MLNSVLSYIISGLNLLWSDRSYTSLGQCVHTDFLDSAVYRVGRTGFLSFFHAFHKHEHCIVHTSWLRGIIVEYGSKLQHRPLVLCVYEDTFISTHSQEINIEVNKTSGQKQQITTYFENWRAPKSAIIVPIARSLDTERKGKQSY